MRIRVQVVVDNARTRRLVMFVAGTTVARHASTQPVHELLDDADGTTTMEGIARAVSAGFSVEIETYTQHVYQLNHVAPENGWDWYWAEIAAGRVPGPS